jgi:outer membrane protein OmpA-like peptidoglycan-associated protein
MKLRILICLFIVLMALSGWARQRDTIRLFYDINKSALLPQHKATIDSLNHLLSDTTTVHVSGFADYLGRRDSNYTLSTARAETVKNYLLNHHSGDLRITADGRGQVNAAAKTRSVFGEPFNRRVDVIVSKQVPTNKTIVKTTPVEKAVAQPAPRDKGTLKARPVDKFAHLLSRDPIVSKKKDDSVYFRINDLPKLNVGDSVSFKEMTFQPGRHFLRPGAVAYMVALKDCLKQYPNLKIEIQGHICCQTDGKDGEDFDTHKNNLSITRAKFIYDYLVSEGITAERLRYKGLGSKVPKVFPELSAEDQYQNRRVVIVLLGK